MSANQQVHRLGSGFALFNLIIAASLGAFLRLAFVTEIPWGDFKHLLHAHSHLAMLGWATIAIFAFYHFYFLKGQTTNRLYLPTFLLLELSAVMMTAGFAINGYAFWSILGASLFILLSFGFFYLFSRDLRRSGRQGPSVLLVKTSIWFFIISTLFLWSLGPVIALGFRYDKIFYLIIQAFLHFQLNGWFTFSILALFFNLLESRGLFKERAPFRKFYFWLLVSTPLTYALAVAWFDPKSWVFLINSTGVILQGIALYYFLILFTKLWPDLRKTMHHWIAFLLTLAILCFVIKVLMQTMLVIPWLATVAYTIRYFVIGFLHLILLGFVSISLLAYFMDSGSIGKKNVFVQIGIIAFCGGFLLSEVLFFTQGIMAWGAMGFLWNYYLVLFIVSCLMPVGTILLFFNYLGRNL